MIVLGLCFLLSAQQMDQSQKATCVFTPNTTFFLNDRERHGFIVSRVEAVFCETPSCYNVSLDAEYPPPGQLYQFTHEQTTCSDPNSNDPQNCLHRPLAVWESWVLDKHTLPCYISSPCAVDYETLQDVQFQAWTEHRSDAAMYSLLCCGIFTVLVANYVLYSNTEVPRDPNSLLLNNANSGNRQKTSKHTSSAQPTSSCPCCECSFECIYLYVKLCAGLVLIIMGAVVIGMYARYTVQTQCKFGESSTFSTGAKSTSFAATVTASSCSVCSATPCNITQDLNLIVYYSFLSSFFRYDEATLNTRIQSLVNTTRICYTTPEAMKGVATSARLDEPRALTIGVVLLTSGLIIWLQQALMWFFSNCKGVVCASCD